MLNEKPIVGGEGMLTFSEFYDITSALEDAINRHKEGISVYQERIKQYQALGDIERYNRVFGFLHRKERKIEETRALIFKTEAFRRWTEAERILFPERFTS